MATDKLSFGIINIDKSSGPTSFSVSDFVRKKLNLSKTSHMGTLDPKVTGVLPITLGKACRLASHLIGHDKTYVGILHTHKEQDMNFLQDLINKHFVGKIKQTPPHKSAVKRQERERTVYYFTLLEEQGKRNFLFECKVEGGTYIRKICSDLGEMIGGAHMEDLRRIAAGIFDETTLVDLPMFERAVQEYQKGNKKMLEAMITPAEEVVKTIMPCVEVREAVLPLLFHGKPLFSKDLVSLPPPIAEGQCFGVFCKDRLIGVYRKMKEKDVFGKAEFVNV